MQAAFPVGARLWIDLIIPEDETTSRAKKAGLYVATLEVNQPRPTSGRVVAIGNDPLVKETFKVGDTVFFGRFAGHDVQLEGRMYRSLELHEITAVLRDEETNTSSS